MKFSLLISVVLPILFSKICEAQVVSLTLNIVESTTVTETTTLSVLGACFSFNSLASSCRRHRHLHLSSLGEIRSDQDNKDALLYNPSAVEKLEVTNGPEEKKFLSDTDTEDPIIIIQSSSKSEQDSKTNFFSPIINDGTGSTVNYNIQSLFAFFRPVLDAWSAAFGATSTFFNTITLTHTTIAYVKVTTSTTTLLINACNDLAIMNSILLDHVPKCPIANHNTTESTTGSTSTIVETPTTSRTTTTLITDETTPVSTNSSSIAAPLSSSPIPTGSTVPSQVFNNTSPKPPVTLPTSEGTIDPIGPTDSTPSSTSLTTTETFTQTIQLTIGIFCAKLVNVTGACRLRRSVWLEEPEILTFNEGMDDVLNSLFTPSLGIEETETTNNPITHGLSNIQDSTVTDNPSELASSQNFANDDAPVTEKRVIPSLPVSYIMNFFKPLTSMLRWRRNAHTILSINTTVTVTDILTTTDTIFIQKCTPLSFTISTCLRRR